jgi:nucleotide-binding universal stress UspA family protein
MKKGDEMFKNILVPYDGSDLSKRGLANAVKLAKSVGAEITGLHVVPDINSAVRAYLPEAAYMPEDYSEKAAESAQQFLNDIKDACQAEGVTCSTHYKVSEFVADEIVDVANQHGCDLIAIASHGRTGIAKVMLGSQTQKVLANAHIPVLVLR